MWGAVEHTGSFIVPLRETYLTFLLLLTTAPPLASQLLSAQENTPPEGTRLPFRGARGVFLGEHRQACMIFPKSCSRLRECL